MPTRLFEIVNSYTTGNAHTVARNELVRLDLTAIADNVALTLQGGTIVGQVIGVQITEGTGAFHVTWAVTPTGPLSELSVSGDSMLVTWSGSAWVLVEQGAALRLHPVVTGGHYDASDNDFVVRAVDAADVNLIADPPNGACIAIKNAASDSCTINSQGTNTIDQGDGTTGGALVLPSQDSIVLVFESFAGVWWQAATTVDDGFTWHWADAAARNAQVVSAADAGCKGWQADIRAGYELSEPSPIVWRRLPDGAASVWNGGCASANTASAVTFLGATQSLAGTPTARACADTSNATRLAREGLVTAAVAGAGTAYRRAGQGTTSGVHASGGWRQQFRGVISAPAAPSMCWFMGTSTTGVVVNVNTDPVTFINALGLGRTFLLEANVQLMHNDAAGNCTLIDLGAAFPHGDGEGYELELYTEDGSEYAWQVTNLNTLAQLSGILNGANLPADNINTTKWYFYSTNNADAVGVSLDFANYSMWQQQYAL